MKLKPCPFCSDPTPRPRFDRYDNHHIICPSCGARTDSHPSSDDAAATWNHRSPPPELVEVIGKYNCLNASAFDVVYVARKLCEAGKDEQ